MSIKLLSNPLRLFVVVFCTFFMTKIDFLINRTHNSINCILSSHNWVIIYLFSVQSQYWMDLKKFGLLSCLENSPYLKFLLLVLDVLRVSVCLFSLPYVFKSLIDVFIKHYLIIIIFSTFNTAGEFTREWNVNVLSSLQSKAHHLFVITRRLFLWEETLWKSIEKFEKNSE